MAGQSRRARRSGGGALKGPPGVALDTRARLRRLWFGLATITGLAHRGFFIPYRYADQVAPPEGSPPGTALFDVFDQARPEFHHIINALNGFDAELNAIGHGSATGPRWGQDWFARLDAAVAYALVRTRKPRRIVEVGSGHSTRFLARAIGDGTLGARLTAIDPAPRASVANLRDGAGPITVHRCQVQRAPFDVLSALGPGDILFIDSSHILMPGTDVDFLMNAVLPVLPAGVLVHVHDIFLPDPYPAEWAWRGYNEQLAWAPLLVAGGWRVLFASRFVCTRMGDALAASVVGRLPLPAGAYESSLWLEKSQNAHHVV